jgi:hypothetical protein
VPLPSASETSKPGLVEDHDHLEKLFADAVALARQDDRSGLGPMWAAFEHQFLLHLRAEDLLLIPGYAVEQPDTAAALKEDHAFLRAAVIEFGVKPEVRLRSVLEVETFLARLRTHAQAEDSSLYAWAHGRIERGHARRAWGRSHLLRPDSTLRVHE